MRDIEAAYRDALIEEHASYVRGGRTAEAENVAEVLRKRYDHDVNAKTEPAKKPEASAAPERADAEKPPEAAVEPKPRRSPRAKSAGDKAGE